MIIDNMESELSVDELLRWIDDPDRREEYILVDLRDEAAYKLGTIPGARSIPLNRLGRLAEVPVDRTVILFCRVGENSRELIPLVEDMGGRALSLRGGYVEYLRRTLGSGETDIIDK